MRPQALAKALCALWLTLSSPALGQNEPEAVQLQLNQAREVALNALRSGQPRLAFALSDGLLEADPTDGHALYIKAKALGQMQEFDEGRKTAALAYNAASTDLQHYESATLAAQLSFAGQRMTHSQVWLRRAAHHAPDETLRNASIIAFREVRNQNPFNVQLSFSVSPSDNVNNGSNSPRNIIDGVPVPGILSLSAQAISGWTATLNMQGSYRFRETETSQTRVVARAFLYQVDFNNPVPGLSASDLSSERLQLGLAHIWSPSETGFWRFDVNGGRTWYGGDPFYDFVSASAQRVQKLDDNWRLSFGGAVEHQLDQTQPSFDATVWFGLAGLTYAFEGGSTLGISARYREIVTDSVTRASQQWTGVVRYTHGRRIGPAEISVSLGHSTVDYDDYIIPFVTPVPGRTDDSWFGEVTATLKSASYMGFVPVVSLRSEQSRSNISRFDVDQTGVTVGIRSEF
ncbi:MAG: hypothetical protein AAFY25_04290 [Pseudomonadota bacterium]